MNTIQFYDRYYPLARESITLDATRKDMPEKEVRIKELELTQKTNKLFADYLGSQLDILA